MENNPLVQMTIPERLDAFLLDTFQTHTHHGKTMTYAEIWDCYEQWCEALGIPPIGGRVHMGAALRKRFFCIKPNNQKKWFIEPRADLQMQEDELDLIFTDGVGTPTK
jgi:hypothetical protein